MPIQFENTQIPSLQFEGKPIKEAYFEDKLVYSSKPKDEFRVTLNSLDKADSGDIGLNGNYALENSFSDTSFDFFVDWGDGIKENVKGDPESYRTLYHEYPQSNTLYNVRFYPNKKIDNGWGYSIDFWDNTNLVSIDSGMSTNMLIRDNIYDSLLSHTFDYCINLESISDEFFIPEIPRDKNVTCDNFMEGTFTWCKKLKKLPKSMQLSNLVAPGWQLSVSRFCEETFYRCYSLEFGAINFLKNFNSYEEGFFPDVNSFINCFGSCHLLEDISPQNIPILNRSFAGRNTCFSGNPENSIKNCPVNWK